MTQGKLQRRDPDAPDPDAPLWIDLFQPSAEDRSALESQLELSLPTYEDMTKIETSSRLYAEDDTLFMTILVPVQTDSPVPTLSPLTFVLTHSTLITIRYDESRTISGIIQRAEKSVHGWRKGQDVLLDLLDGIVDRLAERLERAGADLDTLSHTIFSHSAPKPKNAPSFQPMLTGIAKAGDLVSKINDSLLTLERQAVYLGKFIKPERKDAREQISALGQDIQSFREQSGFLTQKTTFLLDATLGLINIEQNAIIKIFSVVSVIFVPPTLVASIYGMNFAIMPELSWPFGYPFAIGLMALSMGVPYAIFKRRGWL